MLTSKGEPRKRRDELAPVSICRHEFHRKSPGMEPKAPRSEVSFQPPESRDGHSFSNHYFYYYYYFSLM